jgi:hypothetical protein
MTGDPRELTREEREELARLRGVVIAYHRAGLDASHALRGIRDRRLWRADTATWEGYCPRFLSMSKQRANQLIKFADVVDVMAETGVSVPVNERQARALGGLSEDERAEVADRVEAEGFGRGFEGVSGPQVEAIVNEVRGDVGAEVVPLRHGDVIAVRDRGGGLAHVPLSESGFLRLLDRLDADARKLAHLLGGPAGVEEAMAAIPDLDGVRRSEQVERIYRVARWLMAGAVRRWPEGHAYGQERWAFEEDWLLAPDGRAARLASGR